MKNKDFEDFLEEKFTNSSYSDGVLDDDLQDKFDDWLAGLDIQEMQDFGEEWGKLQYTEGYKLCEKAIMEALYSNVIIK